MINHQKHIKKPISEHSLVSLHHLQERLLGGGQVTSCCSSDNILREQGTMQKQQQSGNIEEQTEDEDIIDIMEEQQLNGDQQLFMNDQHLNIPKIKQIIIHKQKEFNTVYDTLITSQNVNATLESKSKFNIEIQKIVEKCFHEFRDVLHLLDRQKINDLCNLIILYLFSDIDSSLSNETHDKQDNQNEIENNIKHLFMDINNQLTESGIGYPCLDLHIKMKFLSSLISYRQSFDEKSKPLYQKLLAISKDIIKVVMCSDKNIDLIKKIKVDQIASTIESASKVFNEFIQVSNTVDEKNYVIQKNNNEYQTNNPILWLNIIWMKKTQRFQQQIKKKRIQIEQELEFYISLLSQLAFDSSSTDLVNYILLQTKNLLDTGKRQLSSLLQKNENQTIKDTLLKFAKMLLINKEDSQNKKVQDLIAKQFIDPSCRFLVACILLYLIEIDDLITEKEDREIFINVLSLKYLLEKQESVKIIFMYNKQISDFINNMSTLDSTRKQKLVNEQRIMRSIIIKHNGEIKVNQIQDNIQYIDDINTIIQESLISRWERERRQNYFNNLLAHNDDTLLDVTKIYINQSMVFVQGNNIFEFRNRQTNQNNHNNDQPDQESINNASDRIITDFLISNYQHSSNIKSGHSKDEGNGCKILSILAEGGIGKSILLKKLETQLINRSGQAGDDNANFIPLLIRCSSLNETNPSIEEYLKEYESLGEQQIDNLKSSERNKLIMLEGYDEYPGEFFIVYEQLNLNQWKNTLVIVTACLNKISIDDAEIYFNYYNDSGEKTTKVNHTLAKLLPFSQHDIKEYFEIFKKEEILKKGNNFNSHTFDEQTKKSLSNENLISILKLPINLYLIAIMSDSNESDSSFDKILSTNYQIEIFEYFFKQQFSKHSEEFMKSLNGEFNQTLRDELHNYVMNSFFEYFQGIAMTMFLNKGEMRNQLSVDKNVFQKTQFKLRDQEHKDLLSFNQLTSLKKYLNTYLNSKVITRITKSLNNNDTAGKPEEADHNQHEHKQKVMVQFRHKSIFEYFCIRAMKYDFDIHKETIWNLSIEQLEQFNINKIILMNPGCNQSEQTILLNLYKLISFDKSNSDYSQNYKQENIEENNRYIQYIKRSQIEKITEVSRIDKGASNLLSALFVSKSSFDHLDINKCSFSQSYIMKRNDNINFHECNLSQSFLKNMHTASIETSNVSSATFDSFEKEYDIQNGYSFNDIIFKNNSLVSINNNGQINTFKYSKNKFDLSGSHKITCSPLKTIAIDHNNQIITSALKSILIVDPTTFDVVYTHKFNHFVSHVSLSIKNQLYLVLLHDMSVYQGNSQIGFQPIRIKGKSSCFSPTEDILVVTDNKSQLYIYKIQFLTNNLISNYQLIKTIEEKNCVFQKLAISHDGMYLAASLDDHSVKVWNIQNNFEFVSQISEHIDGITTLVFSPNGRYLATGSSDNTCKFWDTRHNFEHYFTIEEHEEHICSIAFSKTGKYMATGSLDNICLVWNTNKDFEFIDKIHGHTSYINSAIFSPNGKYLATGSADNTCKIWDAQNGFELLNSITGHTHEIYSVAFTQDGKYLATGSWDNTCKVWDVEKNFQLIKSVTGHTSYIKSVAFSPNGKHLATGSADYTCKIWDTQRGYSMIESLKGQYGVVKQIAYSPDGKYLAMGSEITTCLIWGTQKGYEINYSLNGHFSNICTVAFSNCGKYFATGSADKTCKIWNVQNGFELLTTLHGHTGVITQMSFSPDGRYLATGSSDKMCKVWNTQKHFKLTNTIIEHTQDIYSVSFSPDSKYLVTGSADTTCKIYNTQKIFEEINQVVGYSSSIKCIAFSIEDKFLVTSSSTDRAFKVWNVKKGFEFICEIQCHTEPIISMAFSPCGKYLATGSADKIFSIWNPQKDFEHIISIQGHNSQISAVAFSPEGKYLVTASWDKSFKIWNTQNGFELISQVQGHTSYIKSLTFSPDGKYLATGSDDKSCKIWNTQQGFQLIYRIQEHYENTNSIIFSPDGKYLVTNSLKNSCRIWDTENNFELIHTIQGHSDHLNKIIFSPDAQYLITSSADRTCKIWNSLQDFELVNTLKGHTEEITQVSFSHSGEYLATGSLDKTCKVWNSKNGFEMINNKIKMQENILDSNIFQCEFIL